MSQTIQIFIPSYNRAGKTKTPALLEACDVHNYKIIVRPSQYEAYAQFHDKSNLIKLDANEGLSYAREFIRRRVKRGEWCLHMDDNVLGFQVPKVSFYRSHDHLDLGQGTWKEKCKRASKIMSRNVDFEEFYNVVIKDTIKEADKRGAALCGFAALSTGAFRLHKWIDVGYVCGKIMLMKNVGFPWRHIKVSVGEDYALTAAHLLKFGRILINKWGWPRRTHYAPGGCGTYEERLPEMIRTSVELMRRYPGLFREKPEDEHSKSKGELRIRFHNLTAVERWRKEMGVL